MTSRIITRRPTKSVSISPEEMSAQSPKSHNFTMPASPARAQSAGPPTTKTFSGLTSRCAMPARCACRSANAVIRAMLMMAPASQPRG